MGILSLLLGYIIRDQMTSGPPGPSKEDGQALEDRYKRPRVDGEFDQVAGMKCVKCKSNIVAHFEGQRCSICTKAVHRNCAAFHLSKCGAPDTPYR